jgi:dihydrofolate synthase/folylpolyglutamate synthase
VEKVVALAAEHNLKGEGSPSVAEAYERAKTDASEADFIFVGGSSYVVADLLSSFRKSK